MKNRRGKSRRYILISFLCVGEHILLTENSELSAELLVVCSLEIAYIAVCVKAVVVYLYHTDGNVGAVVCHSFVIRDKVGQHKAHFNGAFSLTQTLDVSVSNLGTQIVDYFFKRFNRFCLFNVSMLERRNGGIEYFV